MPPDEIIEEVWRNRDAYVEHHHHDLDEIVADLRERQRVRKAKVAAPRRRREPPQAEE